MATAPEPNPTPSSKEMLAHLIGVVCPILLVAQSVLFFAFRWVRVERETIGGGTLIKWSISPWIVWLSVGIVMLAAMLATTCRGHVQRWHRWAVGVSLAVGIAVAAWGLALEAPDDIYYPPEGRGRDATWPNPPDPPIFW